MLKLTVTAARPLTDKITGLTFACAKGQALPQWTPGAHLDFETPAGPRSYSLIQWPRAEDGLYHIAVLREDGGQGGSKAMHQLGEGDLIQATAPSNDFELAHGDKPVLLLAGGIGVTPLISMATRLQAAEHPFAFHYAGRSAEVMAFLPGLQSVFADHFTAHFDNRAPLDLQNLMQAHSDHAVYICGPRGMIDAARSAAEAAGLQPEDIHVELFTTAAPTGGDTAFEVEISSTGQVVPVAADQTIIEALENAGIDLIYDCQRGDCGICQTDVISGTPDHRDVVLSQSEKDSGKLMQICVSRALSDRLVLDL